MSLTTADEISAAIVILTGRRHGGRPEYSWRRLVDELGEEVTTRLMPVVARLLAEFYESDAHQTAADRNEMHAKAVGRFRALYPELSDEALEAMGWCYTWDYR